MTTSLADQLRALPDAALAELLRARPDLTVPLPGDLGALANRLQTRLSVARALDDLDQFTVEVLDALRLLESPASLDQLFALLAPHVEEAQRALDRLRALQLVIGPDSALRPVAVVAELSSPYPCGLGRPLAELGGTETDAKGLRRTVMAAPPEARAVLEKLAAGPPVGTLNDARAAAAADETPVRWLINRGLLVPISDEAVELPREVGLLLRRDSGPTGPLHPVEPASTAEPRPRRAVDQAGAGQAIETVRRIEALLTALPAPQLKSGGIGGRDLRRLAKAAGTDDTTAGLLLETAHAAGLIGVAEDEWLPTPAYDTWLGIGLSDRWQMLAVAWLGMPRQPSLIGTRDDRDRPVNALSPELARAVLPRRAILGALPADDVVALLRWRAPRRYNRPALIEAILAESAELGVTGLGSLTSFGAALLAPHTDDDPLGIDDPPPSPADLLAQLLPAPVDKVVLQADLTIVVPGPPSSGLATELGSVAELESANVHRVTPESLRGALDSGYTPEDLHELFARRSSTPVPQSLTYLIDDMARRHGGLRTGSATAYLRSEDTALLAELVADRRLAGLGLRRIAPTVLISPHTSPRLVEALRDAGYTPVPEDASGGLLLTRQTVRRAPPGVPQPPIRTTELPLPYAEGLVDELRLGDARARAARRAPVVVTTSIDDALVVMNAAIKDRKKIWVGYIDPHGSTISRLVQPISIGAGYLRAEDERNETLHTFALARITSATLA